MTTHPIHGLAIVSDDDCIAAADGAMPPGLRNAADWAYFQARLDEAALVVTGRLGHEAHPNKAGRTRLVFSTRGAGLESDGDLIWFNPARARWSAVLAALPRPGAIAVTGGGRVFDWFIAHEPFDAFHLSRARGVLVPNGRRLFPTADARAEDVLATHGLSAAEERVLDPAAPVILTRYERLSPRPDAS